MNRTLAAVSVLAFAAASPALAADMYAPGGLKDSTPLIAAPLWTGFYLGVNGGYGENASSRDVTVTDETTLEHLTAAGASSTGFFGGGQIGYRQQINSFVLGAELSIDGSTISGDNTATQVEIYNQAGALVGHANQVATHQQLDYFGTLDGIVGLPFGNFLPYVKGGLAFGQVSESIAFGATNPFVLSHSGVDTGWNFGGGVAYKFAPSWDLFVEYDYLSLTAHPLSGVNTTGHGDTVTSASISEDFSLIKAGVNYQMGGNYAPLK